VASKLVIRVGGGESLHAATCYCVGSGAASAENKLRAILHGIMLELPNPLRNSLVDFLSCVCSFTTDMGTELGIANYANSHWHNLTPAWMREHLVYTDAVETQPLQADTDALLDAAVDVSIRQEVPVPDVPAMADGLEEDMMAPMCDNPCPDIFEQAVAQAQEQLEDGLEQAPELSAPVPNLEADTETPAGQTADANKFVADAFASAADFVFPRVPSLRSGDFGWSLACFF
jgi:hypothetical protein